MFDGYLKANDAYFDNFEPSLGVNNGKPDTMAVELPHNRQPSFLEVAGVCLSVALWQIAMEITT